MPVRCTARAVAVEDLDDLNAFLIALADDANEPQRTVELQKALEADEDDPDSDTFCVVLDGGVTHFGGVTACHLDKGTLVLRFDEVAARVFETDGVEVTLELTETERAMLRDGLRRLFDGDRLAPDALTLA
ncbi:Imm10 family immunity protein [Deinococcus pimensis]|uniref:Imm10 family immunity protein n=1 Tax=Deinococcus pimensis TaxID=309888 RepID=UPI0004814497|nr:Imm10 family immunity protein [Deinococcus pimensis]